MDTRQYDGTCPICDEPTSARHSPAVDGEAQPEQLKGLIEGRLNVVRCAVCGHSGLVPEPVIISLPSRREIIGYMPVEVPKNRKAHIAGRLKREVAAHAGPASVTAICFGARQLRDALPASSWPKTTPEFRPRFDHAGLPRHRQACLRRALKRRPEHPVLLTRLGIALYEDGKVGAAREVLEQALAVDPNLVDALHCLGSVSLDEGKPAEALALYDRVVSITHDAVPRFLAGVAAYRAGRIPAALERLTQATREAPDLIEAHLWLAIVHLSQGDRRNALAALRRALENGLSDPEVVLSHREFDALRSDKAFRSLMSLTRRVHDADEKKRRRPDHRADNRRRRERTRPPRSHTR